MSKISLFRRLFAIFYDTLLVFSLVFLVFFIVVIFIFDGQAKINNYLFFLITLPVSYFYFSQSWVKGRQTLGMKAWSFQVVQKDNKNITQKQAASRFVLGFLSFILFGFGFIYQLFNSENLTFHDKFSNSFLINNLQKK